MKRRVFAWMLVCAIACGSVVPLRAQDAIVYDPWTWWENVLQVAGFVDELKVLAYQLQRLPVDMINRYRTLLRSWPPYDTNSVRFVRAFLAALNTGDPSGFAYQQFVTALDFPDDVLSRMPAQLRQRLQSRYGAVELADRVTNMSVDQTSNARTANATLLNVIQAMQDDAASPVDNFQSQTALLNKINAASVLDLKLGEKTNEFLATIIEQMTVDQTRRRETEASLMNAALTQWRWGQLYGASLFQNTANNIDNWRLR